MTANNAFLRETIWGLLLESIVKGRIIPILGSEILEINDNGTQIPFYRWVALRLAEANNISVTDLPVDPTLNDVVCRLGDDRPRMYSTIKQIVDTARLEPPAILRKLAEISAIKLFVVLTFDPFMAAALDAVRGQPRASDLEYPEDIPTDITKDLAAPIVYHLFGKLTHVAGGYVVSDEDMLERLYEIQSATNRPNNLFDALANNNLLFIGCNFSDWLARFLIRTAKGKRLSAKIESEILVDSLASRDSNLVVFLKKFSPHTYILPETIDDFIGELEKRWRKYEVPDRRGDGNDMADNSIFISYCREDIGAANLIATSLDNSGFNVWIDRRNIKEGSDYTHMIHKNIQRCSCFLPIISTNSLSQNEGYFRKEWHWAADRAEGFSPNARFIVPVIIDDTEEYSSEIPRAFRHLHISRFPGGEVSKGFTEAIRQIVRENTKRRSHG